MHYIFTIILNLKCIKQIVILECKFIENKAYGSGGSIRISMSKNIGLGSYSIMKTVKIKIDSCTFKNNFSNNTSLYSEDDVYFQVSLILFIAIKILVYKF